MIKSLIDDVAFALTLPEYYLPLTIYVGICIGSFINVLAYRLPKIIVVRKSGLKSSVYKVTDSRHKQFLTLNNRSSCPECKTQLLAIHNIPVLSYLALRGKCGFCKAPISARYPLIESLTCLISFVIVYSLSLTIISGLMLVASWVLITSTMISIDKSSKPLMMLNGALWATLIAVISTV